MAQREFIVSMKEFAQNFELLSKKTLFFTFLLEKIAAKICREHPEVTMDEALVEVAEKQIVLCYNSLKKNRYAAYLVQSHLKLMYLYGQLHRCPSWNWFTKRKLKKKIAYLEWLSLTSSDVLYFIANRFYPEELMDEIAIEDSLLFKEFMDFAIKYSK